LGAHIITLRAFTTEGCRGRLFKDTVKVMPRPSAQFTYRTLRNKICSEDSVLLLAIDSSNYRNAYTWHPQHYFFEGNGPKAWGKIDNSGFITLNVVNEFGCTASDSLYLNTEQCCKVSFPTAFTPNGDGKNDVFRPIFEGFHRFSVFRVVNRWGQTVFETTNSNGHWDGTLNGEPQDLGVYFYMLKYDCNNETVIEKGEVTLIR
jgi:gliding motility-associated-like protein